MPTATSYEVLYDLVSELSARWHTLIEAVGTSRDPAERSRLLAVAESVEVCDREVRRAVRDLRPTVLDGPPD